MGKIHLGVDSFQRQRIQQISFVLLVAVVIKELLCVVGVIIHEFSHYLFAKLYGLKTYDWKLFTTKDLQNRKPLSELNFGMFKYEQQPKYTVDVAVNLAPLFINTAIGTILLMIHTPTLNSITGILYAWIVISIFAKAIPSVGDIKNIKRHTDTAGLSYLFYINIIGFFSRSSLYMMDIVLAIIFYHIIGNIV